MVAEGKQRAEGKRGPTKRLRVMTEGTEALEEMERGQKENSGLQLGAEIAEALWCLNNQLASIEDELEVSWEAMAESRLLCWLLT